MTFDRLEKLVPADHILVVTNARYKDQVAAHLPSMPVENILCEPFMRNTAPCIAYANAVIASRDPQASVVVAPSDHLILDESGFLEVCRTALETTRNTTSLVTLGIQPTRPDTGYGYIQYEDPHDEHNQQIMSDIQEKVTAIIVDKLGVDAKEVTTEASFTNDLGADSLDTVELIMEFEKEFNIAIPDDQAEKISTVGQAVDYISQNA